MGTGVIALLFMAACASGGDHPVAETTKSGTIADGNLDEVPSTTTESMAMVIDLARLSGEGFVIIGESFEHLGKSVSAAGDINGDGYADLIIGAYGRSAAEAYVIWGQADKQYGTLGTDGRRFVDTSSLGDAGFIIQGKGKKGRFGASVSSAGDVNGDGYDDLIVGAIFGDNDGRNAGEAYVIWGGPHLSGY